MPEKVIQLIGRIKGQEVRGNLLSDQDVIRLNDTRTRIKNLETKVDELHRYTKSLAQYDFYTDATQQSKMQPGVVYMVGFKGGTFVAPAPSQGSGGNDLVYPDGQEPEYYELVMLSDSGTILKLGKEKYTADIDNLMSKIFDNEYKGQLTHVVEDATVAKATAITKFNNFAAAANPTAKATAGHVAQDKNGVQLFATTGSVDTDGTRHNELTVNKSDGSVAGCASLSASADGSTVTFTIPQPTATPADNEAATVKFVKDAIDAKPNFMYQASKPTDVTTVPDDTLVFFDAVDLIAD